MTSSKLEMVAVQFSLNPTILHTLIHQLFCHFISDSSQEYILVQNNPSIVKGPFLDLQFAKNELKEIAKNNKSRMMIEIINGSIQMDPHTISGIDQSASNGFDKWWSGWDDINAMLEIATQYRSKNTDPLKPNLFGVLL